MRTGRLLHQVHIDLLVLDSFVAFLLSFQSTLSIPYTFPLLLPLSCSTAIYLSIINDNSTVNCEIGLRRGDFMVAMAMEM